MDNNQPQQPNINIKVEDGILKGAYSNVMFASHNKEEFVLDFMSVFGQQGMEVAKVIMSPGHFKRMVAALNDNLKKYEEQFGKIEGSTPNNLGTASESSKFGF
jgi:hypothetical protein